jgi:hypothetical protein
LIGEDATGTVNEGLPQNKVDKAINKIKAILGRNFQLSSDISLKQTIAHIHQ